ncbi:MAG: hypothetical protein JWR73_3082, partial [Tardiphaga sp.]|nr:hypothetical protein [Tardiphaga sp.]
MVFGNDEHAGPLVAPKRHEANCGIA